MVLARVIAGTALSAAMADLREQFSEFQVNMARAGETAGTLPDMLRILEEEETSNFLQQRQLIQQLVSPLVTVVVAAGLMFIVLPLFVFGRYLDLLKDLGLQGRESALLSFMRFTQTPLWWGGLGALLGLALFSFLWPEQRNRYLRSWAFLLRRLGLSENHREYYWAWFEERLLQSKFFGLAGRAWRCHVGSRFTSTLGPLLDAGIPVLHAVSLAVDVSGSPLLMSRKGLVLDGLKSGSTLSVALGEAEVFSPGEMLIGMISVGEESGKQGELLRLVARGYQSDLEVLVRSASAALTPIIFLFLGLIVGGLMVMMLEPMSRVIQSL